MNSCTARQHSDQMVCRQCDHCWDMNDPDPPKCLTKEARWRRVFDNIMKELGYDNANN